MKVIFIILIVSKLINDKPANSDLAEDFSFYFSNLAETLLSQLPIPSNKYGVLSLAQYSICLGMTKKFGLLPTEKDYILKILRDIDTNLSVSLNKFPDAFKLANVNIEKVATEQTNKFLIENNIFYNINPVSEVTIHPIYFYHYSMIKF